MKASAVVHWPGKDTVAREHHTQQLIALGRLMGFSISVNPLVGDVECTNCENEAKKEKT